MRLLLIPLILIISFYSSSQQSLDHLWSAKIGGQVLNTAIHPMDLVIDDHNNKYICGMFSGSHDFNPGPGVNIMNGSGSGYVDNVFVLKLDSLNNYVWSYCYYNNGGNLWNYGLLVDSLGAVYTYGSFKGSMVYNTLTPNSSINSNWWYTDSYLHKLNPNGTFDWVRSWGSNPADGIQRMEFDQDHNFYVLGFFDDSTDVDPGIANYMLTENGLGSSHYLAKYDQDFNFLWAKQFNGTIDPGMKLMGNDEITIGGRYSGIIDFDLGPGTVMDTSFNNGYSYDMFTLVLDRSGNYKWHYTLKAPGEQQTGEIVMDSNKNRYQVGAFYNTMDFNPTGVPNVIGFSNQPLYYSDAFIMKLDSLGNQIWTKAIQGNWASEVQGLIIDNELPIIYGSVKGTTDIDPNSPINYVYPSVNGTVMFVEKIDSNANVLWEETFTCNDDFIISRFKLDVNQNYFWSGILSGTVDMDPGPNNAQLIGNYGNVFFGSFKEGNCASLGADLSNFTNATCSQSGGGNAIGVSGTPPYTFTWLTNPLINNSTLITDTCGLFLLKTVDANGCVDTSSVYIQGPTTIGNIDLDVNLISTNFIQGQAAKIWVNASNGGCQNVSGNVELILDPLTDFDSSSVVPSYINGDTLRWNINYGTSDSSHALITVYVTTSQAAVTGDTVCFNLYAYPFIGDLDTLNNFKSYCEPVLASYDPNDKKVFPKGQCDNYVYLGQELIYTVRFQNTGNSEAINVSIIDEIDPNLNLATLQVLAQSHEGLYVNQYGGREIQFNFKNINLPDSLSDPVGSNGFVVFKISPKSGIQVNKVVSNKVDIYFDFNTPIITNTVSNTFTNDIPCILTDYLGVEEISEKEISVFPNPAEDFITVKISDYNQHELKIFSSTGLLVLNKIVEDNNEVKIQNLPSGIYLLEFDGTKMYKLIIK